VFPSSSATWAPFLPSYDINQAGGVLALLITILAVGACIHLAARAIIKKDDLYRAFAASVMGILLAQLAFALTAAYIIVGLLAAVVAFMLAIGVVYHAKPQGAVSVGAVTWVLWILANAGLAYVQAHWTP
jgi:hypothetical protein